MTKNPSLNYQDYLASEDWRRRRNDFLSLVTGCTLCHSTKNIFLHHLDYDTLHYEQLGVNVVPICHPCHDSIHSTEDWESYNDDLRLKFKSVIKY